jgi:DNA-binding protein HU-beta
MNKTDLINAVASKTDGISKQDVTTAIEGFLSEVTEALANGEKVSIQGFGNFETRERAARKGRNPQTGKEIDIPATKIPAFKPSKNLKELVNT